MFKIFPENFHENFPEKIPPYINKRNKKKNHNNINAYRTLTYSGAALVMFEPPIMLSKECLHCNNKQKANTRTHREKRLCQVSSENIHSLVGFEIWANTIIDESFHIGSKGLGIGAEGQTYWQKKKQKKKVRKRQRFFLFIFVLIWNVCCCSFGIFQLFFFYFAVAFFFCSPLVVFFFFFFFCVRRFF